MAPKVAPPPLAAPVASGSAPLLSRQDPKPVLKASKEWIVPPRPKPGRKSTKPPVEQKPASRTSQKAFRERRQEYVTELEEKVRQLEAGEGEKCVFYQQQAQKAKAETAALRDQNESLKREVERLRREVDGLKNGGATDVKGKGKARAAPVEFDDDLPEALTAASKRPRRSAAVRAQAVVAAASGGSSPSASGSSFTTRTFSSSGSVSAHSPSTTMSSNSPGSYTATAPVFAHSPLNDVQPASPMSQSAHSASAPARTAQSACGFCSPQTGCLCEDLGYEIDHPAAARSSSMQIDSPQAHIVKLEAIGEACEDDLFAEAAYEPAVPLRLRKSDRKVESVWAIAQPHQAVKVVDKALCNGDPSNCPACSDDPFGKAFCNALSTTVCSTQPCANCPGSCSSSRKFPTPPPDVDAEEEAALFESLTDLPCCGDPQLCGSLTCGPNGSSVKGAQSAEADKVLLPRSVEPGVRTGDDTVPCNQAWLELKQHPNIAFADLQMLADVVAKRTHCGGPVLPPSLSVPDASASAPGVDDSLAKRQLVPQSALQCSIDAGTRRRLTVERGAVNEALELLDRAVGRGGPLRR
ncbi:hypothetical protein JCM1841_004868 [Sporobolomyces salmonicolor]